MSDLYKPVSDAWAGILARVELTETGCFLWTGATISTGYGCIASGRKGKTILTHHVAVLASGRSIPEGMTVDHLCHDSYRCHGGRSCQHRRCVNPDHLEVVTGRENTQRKWGDLCRKGHPLSERPDGKRRCVECAREYAAAWREARAAS